LYGKKFKKINLQIFLTPKKNLINLTLNFSPPSQYSSTFQPAYHYPWLRKQASVKKSTYTHYSIAQIFHTDLTLAIVVDDDEKRSERLN
jgi:hypothetical protein